MSVMRVELREADGSGRRRRPWMEAVGGSDEGEAAEMQPRIRERAVSSSSFVMVEVCIALIGMWDVGEGFGGSGVGGGFWCFFCDVLTGTLKHLPAARWTVFGPLVACFMSVHREERKPPRRPPPLLNLSSKKTTQ